MRQKACLNEVSSWYYCLVGNECLGGLWCICSHSCLNEVCWWYYWVRLMSSSMIIIIYIQSFIYLFIFVPVTGKTHCCLPWSSMMTRYQGKDSSAGSSKPKRHRGRQSGENRASHQLFQLPQAVRKLLSRKVFYVCSQSVLKDENMP